MKEGVTYQQCVENIDIGGPSLLRSTAKNHAFTTVVTSPSHYEKVKKCIENNGGTTRSLRQFLAAQAFEVSANYDTAISKWFTICNDTSKSISTTTITQRTYNCVFPLKYGCNPHQKPAAVYANLSLRPNQKESLPFDILHGSPGYINLLDAGNAWQLVQELRHVSGLASAASFKHCSPAGAAIASVSLRPSECQAFEISPSDAKELTPIALAYIRARNADPMCSFGDFIALSEVVDIVTANILKKEVSDGIIAPGYQDEAYELLQKKKGGKFLILQGKNTLKAKSVEDIEYREFFGMVLSQPLNRVYMNSDKVKNVVTKEFKTLTPNIINDMMLASTCVKYTQSNSVGFAKDGMMVGVGAGQQSRVDCVKLAGRKACIWWLRQHPKVCNLQFKKGVKRQDRVNARVRYIEGDFTKEERTQWESLFEVIPDPLTKVEKESFMETVASGVTLGSDAFFPFRDSIDHASRYGVSHIVQPGGSVHDNEVIQACNEYKMIMSFTNIRLFHH